MIKVAGRYWLIAALLALSYFLSAKVGLILAIPPGFASAFYPASGVALAALLIWGIRQWPALLVAAWALNLQILHQQAPVDSYSLLLAFGIACSVVLQAVIGALLVRRFVGGLALNDGASVLRFFFLAGLLSTLISATISCLLLLKMEMISSNNIVFTWWTWWIGDAIGVLLLVPVVFCFFARPAALWRRRRISVALPLLICSVSLITLFVWSSYWESERLRLRFEGNAGNLAHVLEVNFTTHQQVITSIERFYASSNLVSRTEFAAFVRDALRRHSGIQALEWVPEVTAAERKGFELQVRKGGVTGFEIRERSPAGLLVRAQERPHYYPVLFVEPFAGNEAALGFDLGSNPKRLQALQQAAVANRLYATAPIQLVQEEKKRPAILLAYPVYHKEIGTGSNGEERHLKGYALGVFGIEAMVETALGALSHRQIGIELYDLDLVSEEQLLYRSPFTAHSSILMEFKRPLDMGGRPWLLRFTVPVDYLVEHRTWYAWAVLAGGLIFSGLMGAFLLLLTGHTARVEELVAARTGQLMESEAKMVAVVDSALDGIITLTPGGVIQSANPAAGRLFGCATEQLIDQPLARWLDCTKADAPPWLNVADEEGQQVEVGCFEALGVAASGRQIPVEICISPISSKESSLFSCLLHDLTEQKRNDQLKTEFLSTVSHELRTPLTSIYGGLQLVVGGAAGELSEQAKKLLGLALNNSERLGLLINDLLDIQKIEAGCMSLACAPIKASELLQQAALANSGFGAKYEVELTVTDPRPEEWWVSGDRERLVQVLANLISNAVKFSRAGQQVVLALEAAGDRVRFSVTDHGVGIPDHFVGRIFHKFAQADSSDRRGQGGTGLGLSISKALVEQHGGEIGFTSTQGLGSCFYFYLPQIKAPDSSA